MKMGALVSHYITALLWAGTEEKEVMDFALRQLTMKRESEKKRMLREKTRKIKSLLKR